MEKTTIAIQKTTRVKAIDILASIYCQETGARQIGAGEAAEMAVYECLKRRGISFFPIPNDPENPEIGDSADAPIVVNMGSEWANKPEVEDVREGDPETV